ncbi:MAG TPA: cytochrome b/b6 domain-containing protein [Ramlibacter sp.]|nr:cytochrome b/b6 domain-containing protein [Ramlibacter sp.]
MEKGIKMRVKVWDLPTRLFHGLLAVLAVALFVSGKIGGDALEWHARFGYCVAALLLFRLVWGFAGGHWSRFASFPPSLARAWRYLRESGDATPGHNPLGALSIYAMLLFFALQVSSGLFAQTKEDFAGPLSTLVSNAASHWLTGYHRNVGQVVLIALVVLHLAAIAWYFMRGRNLVSAIITGYAEVHAHIRNSRDDALSRLAALVILVACAAAVSWLVSLGG